MSTYTDIGLTVPDSFKVNEGGITVQGSSIRVGAPLGKSRTFSVREAERLILHRPKGRSFERMPRAKYSAGLPWRRKTARSFFSIC